MVAHPGIGAASYINSMNKDKRRKFSAPVLCSPYELAVGESVDAGSVSSDDSVGLVLNEKEKSKASPNISGIFHFQKATAVNLDPISPTLKDDNAGSSFLLMNDAVEEKPFLINRKLRKTKSAEGDIDTELVKRKSSERCFNVEMADLSSKANLLNERGEKKDDVSVGRESPGLVSTKEPRRTAMKRFAVAKTGSKSRLLVESPENGSDDSLSRVVGKLKDKEVFL